MTLPPDRVIALEPRHEPPKPDHYLTAVIVCFAAIVIPLFL